MKYLVLLFLFVSSGLYAEITSYKGIKIKYDSDYRTLYKYHLAIDYIIADGNFDLFKKSGVYYIKQFDGTNDEGEECSGYTYRDGIIYVINYDTQRLGTVYDSAMMSDIIIHEVLHNLYPDKDELWVYEEEMRLCKTYVKKLRGE